MPCKLVRGFQDALLAAREPHRPMPSRLIVMSPDVATFEWLAAWSLTLPSHGRRIVRSGVHPKSFLDVIRAHHKRSLQQPIANDVPQLPTDPSNGDIG